MNRPLFVSDPEEWQEEAECRLADPELFFATDDTAQQAALQLCKECPVREPCLRYAIRDGQMHGVWGGTLEPQRRQLIRDLRRDERERARRHRERRAAAEALRGDVA